MLDTVRRDWLAELARAHASAQSSESAIDFARGAWKCGEYGMALDRFQWAHAQSPRDPEAVISLLHAASMLGRFDIETATLDAASRNQVDSSSISLFRALKRVPGDIEHARAAISGGQNDSDCSLFNLALGAIQSGDLDPVQAVVTDERSAARVASLRWAMTHALTPDVHVGLPIEPLLRGLAAAPAGGPIIECGVYFGRSLSLIAERRSADVHGFDSFCGLPEDWKPGESSGAYSTAGRRPAVPAHVTLHAGWFEDTLPAFFARRAEPVALLHIDCDIYSSTQTVLKCAGPFLVPGSVIVFDDLLGYPGHEEHELRAFNEFVVERALRWELLAASLLGREVAIRILPAD